MEQKYQRTCDMLSTALDMEAKGKAFYEQAAKKCKDTNCRELFKMLAGLEVKHIERIDKIFNSLSRGAGWCKLEEEPAHSDLGKLFLDLSLKHGSKIKADSTDLEALDTGLELENQSIKYYQGALAKAASSEEKQFLEAIVAEEKMHHKSLADLRLYLQNPAAYFNEMEKPHLDGA